ncbi:RibD family protein, partial [Streptomyces albiflaviniger]|nr:RibD family protein [Streptomyces albiflaviniger]
ARLLVDRYLPLCLAGPGLTIAQLGQSLDGFIATRTGDADYVTGEEDRRHLHRLRALADAVVVGAGTAVADDPQLTVRACTGAHPVRVVLDPRGRVPLDRRVFTDGSAPTLWVVGTTGERRPAPPDGVD